MPEDINSRYGNLCVTSLMDFARLNQLNLDYITLSENDSEEYKFFSVEVNRLDLAINAFENLMTFCDVSHEQLGILDFPIDIPKEFFRFPARNNSRDRFSYMPMTSAEKTAIEKVINEARPVFRVRNDENIIRELVYRLEYLSLFSFFEAFLESTHFKVCNPGGTREKSAEYLRNTNKAEAYRFIANSASPKILILLNRVFPDFLKALHYFHLLRNIHTHKMGILTASDVKRGLNYGSIKEIIEIKNGNKVRFLAPIFTPIAEERLFEGNYIPLRGNVDYLRVILREASYIMNHFMATKTP